MYWAKFQIHHYAQERSAEGKKPSLIAQYIARLDRREAPPTEAEVAHVKALYDQLSPLWASSTLGPPVQAELGQATGEIECRPLTPERFLDWVSAESLAIQDSLHTSQDVLSVLCK